MKSESENTARCRVICSEEGAITWRNNVGAQPDGRLRWGLANESAAQNERLKSSDLIGMLMNGRLLAIEVKREGWVYSGRGREAAQKRFIDLVNRQGGLAMFYSGDENELREKLQNAARV